MLNHPHSGIALKNGTGLPGLSFGTWHLTNPEEANRILTTAIEAGYRSFDSALTAAFPATPFFSPPKSG